VVRSRGFEERRSFVVMVVLVAVRSRERGTLQGAVVGLGGVDDDPLVGEQRHAALCSFIYNGPKNATQKRHGRFSTTSTRKILSEFYLEAMEAHAYGGMTLILTRYFVFGHLTASIALLLGLLGRSIGGGGGGRLVRCLSLGVGSTRHPSASETSG
jgi:hypothetical protein